MPRLHAARVGQQFDGRRKIDVPVRDVKCEYAVRRKVAPVKRQGLRGQQMDRDGVAREGIDDQNIELLRRFLRASDVRASPSTISTCAAESRI